jgi:hypothetical protein
MQEAAHIQIARVQESLPKSNFVVQARESIPGPRVRITTTSTKGRGRRKTNINEERGRERTRPNKYTSSLPTFFYVLRE